MSGTNDRRGEDILLSLIYPKTIEMMTGEQQVEFAYAADEQLQFMTSGAGAVKQESLGDASVTYADPQTVTCGGQEICPTAIARLMKCGLLTRWI